MYTPRFGSYSLPSQIRDRPNRRRDEDIAELLELLAAGMPLAGGVAGGIAGALSPAGPAGALKGMQIGAGLGQAGSALSLMGANTVREPHTRTDERRATRRDLALQLLGRM